MRHFERDDLLKAAAGDPDAQLRVERRKDVLDWCSKKYRDATKASAPSWANLVAIRAIYAEFKRISKEVGVLHEVDHIVPIQGEKVCGLDVDCNLQILTKT